MSDTGALAGLHPDTLLVQGGTLRSQFGETSEAIFLNSGFVYGNAEDAEARFTGGAEGYVYSRFGNPSVTMFETRMALLEGAEGGARDGDRHGRGHLGAAVLLESWRSPGLRRGRCSALAAVMNEDLLPRFGISSTLIDGRDLAQWRAAVRGNTRVLFCESPANPLLDLVDLAGVASIAKDAGALFMVDNVFATPVLQKPLRLGADVAIYSATKHIDGQGRCLGGVICSNAAFVEKYLKDFLRMTGPSLSPFNAWVLLKGLETLSLRVERQSASAAKIADWLAERPEVESVVYPGRPDHPQREIAVKQMTGGGPLVAFRLRADKPATFRFMNALRLVKISNNLGDAKSLIAHPATTTHYRLTDAAKAQLGITPGTVRLSVGLEHADDLAADLGRALSLAEIA